MNGTQALLEAVGAVVLVAGLGVAAARDIRTREAPDPLWQLLGLAGAVLGAVGAAAAGALPLLVWLVVSALALEHLFPWDDALGDRHDTLVPVLELSGYAVAIAVVAVAVDRWGIGPGAVPLAAVAALATIITARTLFEVGVLYGGADAKALIVTGLLVPIFASPLVVVSSPTAPVLGVLPFSFTLLTNAALLSIGVPIVIAARNVARGEFRFPQGFTTYTMEVEQLPRRFVWVRDPSLGEDTFANDADTSEEDTRRRAGIAKSLQERGVRRVWVSPQLPFLVLMALGAVTGLLAGNLLLDLIGAL